jgi:tetratricopeptide (TPR) repeat protein
MRRRICRRDPTEAAPVAVSLGNVLRCRAEYDKAVAAYDKALRLDPAYSDRAHLHSDRAGALFLAGRHAAAAKGYERALELGAPHFIAALHADARLFAGHYAEAELSLVAFLVSEEPDAQTSEYILKRVLCTQLAARGLDRQVRRTAEAVRLAAGAAKSSTTTAARDLCESAIRADGLCGLAWCNLAIALRELGDPGPATAFLCAALMMEGDPEMWAEALLTPGIDGELDLYMLLTARRMTAGTVFETMAAAARKNGSIGFLERLPELISALPPEHDSDATPITVRLISENGVETLNL